jgi:hypothetical protein
MALRVATVDLLVEKARFEPQVAVAVAQAIDVAMEDKMQDFVTVPVLDARLSEVETRILRHLYTAVLGQLALLVGLSYFFVLHLK